MCPGFVDLHIHAPQARTHFLVMLDMEHTAHACIPRRRHSHACISPRYCWEPLGRVASLLLFSRVIGLHNV